MTEAYVTSTAPYQQVSLQMSFGWWRLAAWRLPSTPLAFGGAMSAGQQNDMARAYRVFITLHSCHSFHLRL